MSDHPPDDTWKQSAHRHAVARRTGAFLLCLVSACACGDESRVQFQVAAHVAAYAKLDASDLPAELHLTPQDIQTGYKDVTVRYVVRSNDPRGVLLRLTPLPGLTTSTTIDGLTAQTLVLHDGEIEIWQKPDARTELRVRLHLILGLRPGTYRFPLHMSVAAISSFGAPQTVPP